MTFHTTQAGPFMCVTRDEVLRFGTRKYRLVLYQAYNALGLIGYENNGIGVLDEQTKQVLLDQEMCLSSGYYGNSHEQQQRFDEIKAMSWEEFQTWVNSHPKRRYTIEDRTVVSSKLVFKPEQFIATKWDTKEKKAKVANALVRFVKSSFARRYFTKELYERLCSMFGFIAHYDQGGFWAEYFESTADKLRFLKAIASYSPMGDSTYTWSDVEREVRRWMEDDAVVKQWETAFAREMETAERAQLAQLKEKYEPNHQR